MVDSAPAVYRIEFERTTEEFCRFNDVKTRVLQPFFQHLDLPLRIDGKDRADFKLEPDTLLHIARYDISKIKYVYATDTTLREFKGRISKTEKTQLMQIINAILYQRATGS